MADVEAVKTTRFTEGVASAASSAAFVPAIACDDRSPGCVGRGDATWTMNEQSFAASM